MRNLIAAIDLGTSKIVCIVGEKTETGVKVIALNEAPSKGVNRGEVVNIQSVIDSVMPTIQNVENAIGEKINDVFVGIAGQNIRCEQGTSQIIRVNPDEYITSGEVREITSQMMENYNRSGEEVLHAIPQSYNIDDFMGITEPVGMIGKQIFSNFKLFIGKKTSSELRKSAITRARLNVKGLILEPLASAKAVLDEDEKEVGVALLDIGGGTTDLVIIQDNIVRHTAVIPFGGNSITEDVKQGCGVSSKTAERLKIEKGSCMSSLADDRKIRINGIGGRDNRDIPYKHLAEIIESRVEELLEAALYEIERSGYKEKLNAGLVITGGTAQLPNLAGFAKLVTGFDTRLAIPDKTFSEAETSILKPSLSTAVGLVLMGAEQMAKEGKGYSSTSPITYKQEEKATVEKVIKEEVKEETPAQPKENNGWGKFWKSLTTDNVFKDNDA
ncbi:MAG: cell division protein FtsA [Bacteroidales bacterium]|nr:cell division protein FtsA [Bacteroidales bacterium]